jgi:hypothetical protein
MSQGYIYEWMNASSEFFFQLRSLAIVGADHGTACQRSGRWLLVLPTLVHVLNLDILVLNLERMRHAITRYAAMTRHLGTGIFYLLFFKSWHVLQPFVTSNIRIVAQIAKYEIVIFPPKKTGKITTWMHYLWSSLRTEALYYSFKKRSILR